MGGEKKRFGRKQRKREILVLGFVSFSPIYIFFPLYMVFWGKGGCFLRGCTTIKATTFRPLL